MKKYFKSILILGLATISLQSCNDGDLEPHLGQDKDTETGISTASDLRTVLVGAYDRMNASTYYGRDIIIFGEVRSDNAFSDGNSNRFVNPARFDMLPTDAYASDTWSQIYGVIASANIVINKDAAALTGDANSIAHSKAEALVIRAMAHFDLLKIYGQYQVENSMTAAGVPYVKTFKDADGLFPARETVQENLNNIMSDLNEAIATMPISLDNYSAQFININVANAVKARVALFFKDYSTAATAAKAVIDSGKYNISSAADFLKTFNTDSTSNQIFSLAQQGNDNAGINGLNYIYRIGSYGDIVILKNLKDIYSSGDVRGGDAVIAPDTKNVGAYRNLGKFTTTDGSDDIPVIRYEDVVLMYAEALLASNPTEALVWLNKIPAQRGASLYSVANLDNVLLERRKEFAFEGHRFWDLIRTGKGVSKVDERQTFKASLPMGEPSLAFPIPSSELAANSNLVQNKGYARN